MLDRLRRDVQASADLETAILRLRAVTTDEDLIARVVGQAVVSSRSAVAFVEDATMRLACGEDVRWI